MATTVKKVIGEVRFSYLHVFEPWSNDPEKDKQYTATLLIPKSNKALVEEVRKAINEAYNISINERWGGKKPAKWFDPLQDGDEPKQDGDSRGEAYEGCWYLNARSKNQPGIVDRRRQTIVDSEEFYSGCFGYASVAFAGFSNSGKYGISCFLNNIMKTRDGEALGGARTTAEQDFKDLNIDSDDDEL